MQQQLILNDIRFAIRLGWIPEEQAVPQTVRWDIVLRFEHNPSVQSDELTQTVCYASLIAGLKQHLQAQTFKLIEHACYEAYGYIKQFAAVPLCIRLTKLHPPVEELHGGAAYQCSDFE